MTALCGLMNLLAEFTSLARVSEINIPAEYHNRIRTNHANVDAIFGDGILPGSVFTIAAPGGTGKSVFLLQLCEMLTNDYRIGYMSGEENIYMVALAARRLQCQDVRIASESRLSKILEAIESHDLLILDSFPCIVYDLPDADEYSRQKQSTRNLELIVKAAKLHKCSIGFVLHMTKDGKFKGSTDLNHAVECNVFITKDADDEGIRVIETRKNRLGACGEWRFAFGYGGYNFNNVLTSEDDAAADAHQTNRGKARNKQMQQILELREPPHINVERVCEALDVDAQRAKYLLWLLTSENKLIKFGRGNECIWKHKEVAKNSCETQPV
jgi:predicted ATP-dependent serine protease